MARQNRIPLLLVAAGIQYLGSSTRRQYETLLKIAAVVVPSMRDSLDRSIGGKDLDVRTTADNFGKISAPTLAELGRNLSNPAAAIRATIESIKEVVSDVVFALVGALLMAFASIWLVFGFLVELLLGLVAEVIRGNGGVAVGKRLRDAMTDLKGLHDQLLEAWNSSLEWDLVASFSTTDRDCAGTPLTPSSTSEPNFVTAYSFCAQTSGYREAGVRLDYRLNNGRIELRDWSATSASQATSPGWLTYATGGGISYHLKREGQRSRADQLPLFDMIVASNDRVFAKVKGKADFWFGTPAEMFAGTDGGTGLHVPSLYFKIDPKPRNPPLERVRDISAANGELKAYSREHPQAARLPLLHALIGGGALPAVLVSVKPRTMYQLDTRPPRVGVSINTALTAPRTGLQTRAASKHKVSNGPEEFQYEFDFDRVQGLGVGNYHFYENWTADQGGEIQFLLMNSAFGLRLNPALYGLFNGPITDADGACDGTCNFYVLARLKRKNGNPRWGILWCDEQTFFTKRWRLVDPRDNLPAKLDLPDDVNLSVHALVENDARKGILNGMIDFDVERFLDSDPFERGWVDERSRLAVARQVLVVNGTRQVRLVNGANRQQDCLYSINFSYGSIDRQWRVRALPAISPFGGRLPSQLPPEFDFDSLHLREDMTISLRGSREGPNIDGRWVQRYLPCDRRYPSGAYTHPWRYLPEASYQRLLRYPMFGVLSADVDGRNQCYEIDILEVDGVSVAQAAVDSTLTSKLAALDSQPMADFSDKLYIRARVFKWGAMNDPVAVEKWLSKQLPDSIDAREEIGEAGDQFFFSWHKTPVPNREYRLSRTSMYNSLSQFRILQRGQLGWLLVWKDKRDDDLISLSDLPIEVTLESETARRAQPATTTSDPTATAITSLRPDFVTITDNQGNIRGSTDIGNNLANPTAPQRIKVRINRHQRIELPPCASRVDFATAPASTSDAVVVRIHSPLPPVQFLRNVWKLHLAALPDGARAPVRIGRSASAPGSGSGLARLLEQGLHIQGGTLASTASGGSIWSMTVGVSTADIDALREVNAGLMATCVWLEGPTGMVSTPDLIQFMP